MSFDNLLESIENVGALKMTLDLWSFILKVFEPYKTQDSHVQFMIVLLDRKSIKLPDIKGAMELVRSIKEHCSDIAIKIRAEVFVNILQFLVENKHSLDPYNEFINQLLRENIFVTSQKNAVPLIAVFCAMKGFKVGFMDVFS